MNIEIDYRNFDIEHIQEGNYVYFYTFIRSAQVKLSPRVELETGTTFETFTKNTEIMKILEEELALSIKDNIRFLNKGPLRLA